MNKKKSVIQGHSYGKGIIYRVCPNCNEEKPLSSFGLREMKDGTVRNQSWCKSCRSGNSKQR